MAASERVDHGRFRPGLCPEELLPLVAQVSLAAAKDPREVFDVTQAQFDAKAAELGVEIPKAKSLASRFAVRWRELLEIAHASPQVAARRLGLAVSDRSRKAITPAECVYAIRRIARSLGTVSLTREDYASEREAMIARTGRSQEAQMAAEMVLPSLNQIAEVIHQEREQRDPGYDWDHLLEAAGLQRRTPGAPTGLTPTQAVELFAAEFGKAPSGLNAIKRWSKARGLSCSEVPTAVVRAEVEALNRRRAAEGLEPLEVLNASEIDWAQVQPEATPTRTRLRPRGSWVKSNCVAGMALAMTKLKSGERLTQTRLKREAKGDPDVPGYTQVHDAVKAHNVAHGCAESFDDWRHEAARLATSTPVAKLREMAAPVLADQQLAEMNENFAKLREDPQAAAEFDAETAAWDQASADVSAT